MINSRGFHMNGNVSLFSACEKNFYLFTANKTGGRSNEREKKNSNTKATDSSPRLFARQSLKYIK